MNGLEIAVIVILALFAVFGYFTGFLRMVYSLAAWALVLVFVTFVTPYAADFLETNTNLKTVIKDKCIDYISEMAEERIVQGAEAYGSEQQQKYGNSFFLPESIIKEITGSAGEAIGGILAESGIYEEIAEQISHYIIKGIAFFITLLLSGIIVFWMSHVLNLISHIPVVQGPNKILGAAVGALKGLILVWLIFYMIELCSTSESGMQFLQYIEESPLLSFLYHHNIILRIIKIFL